MEEIGLLGRAKLRREAKRARLEADKLRVLHSIGSVITSALQVEEVLTRVVEAAVFITSAEESSLLLLDKETQELYLRAQKGLGAKYAQGFKIRTEDSIAGDVVRTGQPQRLTSSTNDLKVVTGYMVNSILYVPVFSQGVVLGVLSVDNQVSDRAFADSDEQLLTILAGYASMALEHAGLVEELDHQTQVLADTYGISRLELDPRLDPGSVAMVMYQDTVVPPSNGLHPEHLAGVIDPYLSTLAELQYTVDQVSGNAPSQVRVLAVTHSLPAVASMKGVMQAVQLLDEIVIPRKRALSQAMSQLRVKEKEAALAKAEIDLLRARASAAHDAVEREQLLAQVPSHVIEVERWTWGIKQLQRELERARIQMALELLLRINPELSNADRVSYAIRLLPLLEHVLTSPLHASVAEKHLNHEPSPEADS